VRQTSEIMGLQKTVVNVQLVLGGSAGTSFCWMLIARRVSVYILAEHLLKLFRENAIWLRLSFDVLSAG
jgi:hypothetical protein